MITTKRQFRLHAVGVIACGLVAAAVFLYFLGLSGVDLLSGSTFSFRAAVPSAQDLATHADVREAGVKIGTVRAIGIAGDHAIIRLSIASRYAPIYRDAQVQVDDKSLGGENYVNLLPGSPSAGHLAAGALLPLTDAAPSTQLDQILSTFNSHRRHDVQRILDVLAQGLHDRGGELGGLLQGATDLIDTAVPTSTVLARDRAQLASLVGDFGQVTAALGSRRAAIKTLVSAARSEASAVSSRDAQVRTVLAVLPSVVSEARTAVTHLGNFSIQATPVMHDLRLATVALVPAIRALGPASTSTLQAITALHAFATVATPTVAQLNRFAATASRLLPALTGTLRQSNPMMAYLAPYTGEIGSVFSNLRAATEFQSAISYYGRLSDNINYGTLAGVLNQSQAQALQALLQAGILGSSGALHSNPYPAPGTVGHPSPFAGAYPRLQPDAPYNRR